MIMMIRRHRATDGNFPEFFYFRFRKLWSGHDGSFQSLLGSDIMIALIITLLL